MKNLITKEIIDAEICEKYFPDGQFVAVVHDDSFDEDKFEFLFGEISHKDWKQLLIGNSVFGSYVSDGFVAFVNPDGDIFQTNETSVILAENLTIVYKKEDIQNNEIEHYLFIEN